MALLDFAKTMTLHGRHGSKDDSGYAGGAQQRGAGHGMAD